MDNVDKFLKFRLSLDHRINIYSRLKSYTEEEFPIYESLLKFKHRYDKRKDFRGKVIGHWLERMKHGDSFAKALRGWVPESELNLIAAGEDGKGIDVGLGEAIKFANSARAIKSTIISGAMYPVILLSVILGFVAMFSIQMAPTYLKNLPLERWPEMAQWLYHISTFLVSNWMIALIAMAATAVVIGKTIGSWTGPVRRRFDSMPPWSIYKVYQSSSFLIALASMMQSGVPLHDSLLKIKKTSAGWLRSYIEEMVRNLKKGGKNFGKHLDVGLLDEETAGDVVDYSELGKFEEAVYSIGEKNLEESVKRISSRMAMIRNLMIVGVGLTVGLIYYSSIELNSAVAEAVSSGSKVVGGK